MDSKMSVGLDTPISIGLSGQPWLPTPSPTLKLNTPTLESLQVDNPEGWSNPLSAQNPPLQPQTSNPLNLSTGLTPRFSPGLGGPLASPGVSGEIANVPDSSIPNTSLSDLFRCNEYPFTSAAPPSAAPPSATLPARPTSATRPPFRPPQPPTPGSQPIAANLQQPKTDVNIPGKLPTSQSYVPTFARQQPSGQVHYPQTSQPHQTMSSAPAMGPAAVHGYPYPMVQAPSPPNGLPPRPIAGVATSQTNPNQPHAAVKQAVPPQGQEAAQAPGHRSVLGSGITSNAVQDAQVRARKKAESYAKSRKRKRSDPTEAEKTEKLTEEDAKLTPDELKHKRYQRRLALNRESAAVSRVRRREYVKLLEEELVTAEKERVNLASQLVDMQKEQTRLQRQLQALEEKMGESGDN